MSRSNRGEKGPGYEYWSARPFNLGGGYYSRKGNKATKRRTHKAERRQPIEELHED